MARTLEGFLCLALFWTVKTAPAPDMGSDSCKDYSLTVAGSRVECRVLLTPNTRGDDILGVYANRDWWCSGERETSCCQTCKIVREEIDAAKNNDSKQNTSNSDTENSQSGNDQSNAEDQPDVVETKGTSKVQTKKESDENHNHQIQHFVDKTSQDGPGYEIFVDMQRNIARDRQAIESIDIRIFPGRR